MRKKTPNTTTRSFRLPKALVKIAGVRAGVLGQSLNEYVKRAIEAANAS